MSGWIKLHRKILDWEWYSDINTCRVFIHLLLTANYEDKKWHGLVIKRGQLVTSWLHLSEETGLGVQSVRTSIGKLKSTGNLTVKSTNKFTLLTIEKYEEYQQDDRILTGNLTGNLTGKQQTTNKQLTTTKEYKKERIEEERKETPLPPIAPTPQLPLPDWLPLGEWEAFLEMRKKKKKYPTDRAKQMLIVKLDELRKANFDVQEVIEQSVMNSWSGFFEVKENGKPKYRKDLHPELMDYRDTPDYKAMYGDDNV